jgi:hypothetical protein
LGFGFVPLIILLSARRRNWITGRLEKGRLFERDVNSRSFIDKSH